MKVVVSLGEDPKHRGLVRPLVEQLERRMRLLVERDYRSAVASLEGRCQEVGMGQVMKFPEIGVPWGTNKSSILNHVHCIFLKKKYSFWGYIHDLGNLLTYAILGYLGHPRG